MTMIGPAAATAFLSARLHGAEVPEGGGQHIGMHMYVCSTHPVSMADSLCRAAAKNVWMVSRAPNGCGLAPLAFCAAHANNTPFFIGDHPIACHPLCCCCAHSGAPHLPPSLGAPTLHFMRARGVELLLQLCSRLLTATHRQCLPVFAVLLYPPTISLLHLLSSSGRVHPPMPACMLPLPPLPRPPPPDPQTSSPELLHKACHFLGP